jgi:hypothetical protein
MTRKVLLVLGWLAVIDIVPTLVWGGLVLSSMDGVPPTPPWLSMIWSLTSLSLAWLQLTPPAGLLVEGMASLFLALLVPWLLFTLAGRERRKAALPA